MQICDKENEKKAASVPEIVEVEDNPNEETNQVIKTETTNEPTNEVAQAETTPTGTRRRSRFVLEDEDDDDEDGEIEYFQPVAATDEETCRGDNWNLDQFRCGCGKLWSEINNGMGKQFHPPVFSQQEILKDVLWESLINDDRGKLKEEGEVRLTMSKRIQSAIHNDDIANGTLESREIPFHFTRRLCHYTGCRTLLIGKGSQKYCTRCTEKIRRKRRGSDEPRRYKKHDDDDDDDSSDGDDHEQLMREVTRRVTAFSGRAVEPTNEELQHQLDVQNQIEAMTCDIEATAHQLYLLCVEEKAHPIDIICREVNRALGKDEADPVLDFMWHFIEIAEKEQEAMEGLKKKLPFFFYEEEEDDSLSNEFQKLSTEETAEQQLIPILTKTFLTNLENRNRSDLTPVTDVIKKTAWYTKMPEEERKAKYKLNSNAGLRRMILDYVKWTI
jgi:hypothetical protein